VIEISIPFDDYDLPGYLFLSPHKDKQPRPLLIDAGGGDGTKEECYFYTAAEAIARGLHCITFDGPGQGSVLRLKKKPFLPDWETVIEKVVDYALQIPEIDANKIILSGSSFGGYLASRAVTKEKRIAACVVDPGIFDSYSNFENKFIELTKTRFPELKDAPLYQVVEHVMSIDENSRFMLASRFWRYGAKNIKEMIKEIHQYTLEGVVNQIQCPMLVCDNTQEYVSQGQAKKLYDHLTCPKTYLLFNEQEGMGGHCEPLARRLFASKMYEWLGDKVSL
jgi:pimeloyl-ACP methyl ester carboxylesterase